MKKYFILLLIVNWAVMRSQPILVNNTNYANVCNITYDSLNNKIYYQFPYGCGNWFIPCAINYSLSTYQNLINKHSFSDNTLSFVEQSKSLVQCPIYPVNEYTHAVARQSKYDQNFIFTNFGYHFNKINEDLSLPGIVWSYSPAINPFFKEISTFEIKGDSVFLFQRDSIAPLNYYTLIVKNKINGATIPYNSIKQSIPTNSLGAIEGTITKSLLVANKIILVGNFTASVSGTFISRNIVYLNISTGQLQAPSLAFDVGTAIYDIENHNNKIHLAGKFTYVNGLIRGNYAVIDYNLNLTNDTCWFGGNPANTWVDDIEFYDRLLIAKGNYESVHIDQFAFGSTYVVKIINSSNNYIMPWGWDINLPGPPISTDNTFEMFKNKLYIKNRTVITPFHVYCFEPTITSLNILYPGSALPNPSASIALCAPDNGNNNIFIAPIRYANTYTWTYSGANATIVPIGNGSTAKLEIANNTSNGTLSVTGYNDCGLSSFATTLNVIINLKPDFILPPSPKTIICNPDSTLLLGTTTNTSSNIWWRKSLNNTINSQPYYTKTAGNYYMVTHDTQTGCKDSGMVIVNNFKINPNSKITSHNYVSPLIPIDTITCLTTLTNITAASDTSGVIISWKSIANNSVFSNPLNINTQNNLKVITTRTVNNCVDSSLIVLVAQDNNLPVTNINNYNPAINCSYNTATLNSAASPSNCIALWSGPLSFTSSNPATVSVAGKYYINLNNNLNGCVKLDSVTVTYTNKIILSTNNDTTVCKNSLVNFSATSIGTLSGITYSWNTGNITNTISATPSVSTNYLVFANGPGGCAGIDTIKVTIPSNIQDSILTQRSCNDNLTGSILMFAKGGIPPYKYSINSGTSYTTSNIFTNLSFGSYSIAIKDSIGCKINNTVSISAESELPKPKFLASTKNFKSDSIVLVDISIPKADSVQWILPPQALIIGGDMFNPIITFSDTGSFIVVMKTYYGICIINVSKTIRFSNQDSLLATSYNANGIKTFSVYPNPNTGQFTVFVEFYKKQNASIQVWDATSVKHFQSNYYDTEAINLPVNLNQLINGNYILRVIGEYVSRNKYFIINK